MSNESFRKAESPSIDEELTMTDSVTESDEEVAEINAEDQDECQAGPNLGDGLSFTNQLFVEKPQEEEPEKSNTESEVQSMVTVPIHQDTSLGPSMTTPVIDLTVSQPKSLEHDYSNQLLSDLEAARQKKERDVTFQELLLGLHLHSHHLHLLQQARLVLQVLQEHQDLLNFPYLLLLYYWYSFLTMKTSEMINYPKRTREKTGGNHYLKRKGQRLPNLWTISSSNMSDDENNWATSLSSTYATPAENPLLAKTRDITTFMNCNFEDLNLLLLQGHLDHLPGSDKRWDAKGYKFKHYYTIIESPRSVAFPVNNNAQKIMRFNEIYKFSDGTLTRILDVTRRKEFIAAIERRLKTRRIYQNLECVVGGRVHDIDYRLLQRTE
nr:hypothetical protein [Tanacetum cinerariifolium]